MGRAVRERPKTLADKLFSIRKRLGLSQNEMIARMGLAGELSQSDLSRFESGQREPTLRVLLLWARAIGGRQEAGKYLEMMIDDGLKLKLPRHLPPKTVYEKASGEDRGVSKKRAKRKAKR